MSDTLENIKAVIADRLEVDPGKVSENSNFVEDLGADSLDTYELLQGLEQKFNISISEDEAQNFKTVKDVMQYMEKQK